MHPAAGEPPQQKAVDRAEGQGPVLGRVPRPRHLVEQPGELGAGEVGVDHQPGPGADMLLQAIGHQPPAEVGGAPVLPDDGGGDGAAGAALPQDRGLALVGDADRGQIGGADAGGRDRLVTDGQRVAPDVLGIVLDPAVPWEVLAQLLLAHADVAALAVEHDGPAAGGTLVERENVLPAHVWGSPTSCAYLPAKPAVAQASRPPPSREAAASPSNFITSQLIQLEIQKHSRHETPG